jgi:hypothetical protein
MCLTVAGEQTAQRAGEVQASLVARECDVLVAVGEAPVAADEARYPDATIVAVDEEIDAPPRRARRRPRLRVQSPHRRNGHSDRRKRVGLADETVGGQLDALPMASGQS